MVERAQAAAAAVWWGSFQVASGETLRWRIEGLDLRVRNEPREWQVQHFETGEPHGGDGAFTLERGGDFASEDDATIERWVFEEESGSLRVLPALADRPVVASPRVPTHVLPGQSATLYVGSPVWVRVEVQEPPIPIVDVPIRRPSDTWFGPSRLAGELCYASASRAVQSLERVTLVSHRAVTPLRVENRSLAVLDVERIKLPVQSLSLFADADGALWTNAVTMVRAEDDSVRVDLSPTPPAEAGELEQLRDPASGDEPGLLSRAFLGLFER